MIARHTSIEALTQAAEAVGMTFQYTPERITRKHESRTRQAVCELTEGPISAWQFRLKPISDHYRMWRYAMTKSGERRIDAVCWHGHREFFRALFKIHPNCIIKTRQAHYRGADDFELNYPQSDMNIGSQMYPQNHSTACHCYNGEPEE